MVIYKGIKQTNLNLAQQAEWSVSRAGARRLLKNPAKVACLAAAFAAANEIEEAEAAEYICQEISPDCDDLLEQVTELL